MLAERVKAWTEELKTEGIQEGIEQGRLMEKADTVQALLSQRFGPLSEDNIQRLNQATAEELDQWTEAIFYIESLDDVFGDQ